MKILVLNGSPRLNGNTCDAIEAVVSGIEANKKDATVEIIDINKYRLGFCQNCDACKSNGGSCVTDIDSNLLVGKVVEADMLIFASPVYWWGISAQLKTLIDKMYSRSGELKKQSKNVGVLAVGGAPVTNTQYRLISEQFKCITAYLGWQLVFDEAISAYQIGDLEANQARIVELNRLWQQI